MNQIEWIVANSLQNAVANLRITENEAIQLFEAIKRDNSQGLNGKLVEQFNQTIKTVNDVFSQSIIPLLDKRINFVKTTYFLPTTPTKRNTAVCMIDRTCPTAQKLSSDELDKLEKQILQETWADEFAPEPCFEYSYCVNKWKWVQLLRQ